MLCQLLSCRHNISKPMFWFSYGDKQTPSILPLRQTTIHINSPRPVVMAVVSLFEEMFMMNRAFEKRFCDCVLQHNTYLMAMEKMELRDEGCCITYFFGSASNSSIIFSTVAVAYCRDCCKRSRNSTNSLIYNTKSRLYICAKL